MFDGKYFKAFGYEFFVETTIHRPDGLFKVIKDAPGERLLFTLGYRVTISG